MWTTKAQISLHILAVWSESLPSLFWIFGCGNYQQIVNVQFRLHGCAGSYWCSLFSCSIVKSLRFRCIFLLMLKEALHFFVCAGMTKWSGNIHLFIWWDCFYAFGMQHSLVFCTQHSLVFCTEEHSPSLCLNNLLTWQQKYVLTRGSFCFSRLVVKCGSPQQMC